MQLHIGYDPLRVDMPVIQLVRKEEIARTMLCMLGHLFLTPDAVLQNTPGPSSPSQGIATTERCCRVL